MMEIDGDTLHFQVVGRKGETVDSGSFQRPGAHSSSGAQSNPGPGPKAP